MNISSPSLQCVRVKGSSYQKYQQTWVGADTGGAAVDGGGVAMRGLPVADLVIFGDSPRSPVIDVAPRTVSSPMAFSIVGGIEGLWWISDGL